MSDCRQWPRWLSVRQAATYLGTSPDAIHKRVQRRQLPGVTKRQGRIWIDRAVLDT